MAENSDSADAATGSKMKSSLRRSSTSSAQAISNGGTESSSKSGMPALRQRSASLGKVNENEGGSKRKRDPSLETETNSSITPEPPTIDSAEGSETSSPDLQAAGSSESGPLAKRRKSIKFDTELANDIYCWVCHKEFLAGQPISYCKTCPRSYHTRCIPADSTTQEAALQPGDVWGCPECWAIDRAENVNTRSQAMQLLTLEQFCTLLKFSMTRMKAVIGAEPFLKPVDPVEFPQYSEYVVNAMDLSQLEKNVRRKQYGSTEAFLADTKWILHNSVIFNTCQAKLTSAARSILKVCRQEMAEIENCPDCYLNAHTRKESWFIEVCRRPHMLVWAKLKGFPFWPAKAMKVNKDKLVDVRFFGAHDRAWVPVRDCYLYSREMPSGVKPKKKNNLDACIEEVEQHAMRLKERFGAFTHAPPRTPYDPDQQEKQLNMLLPNYQPGVDGKRARTILHPEISTLSRTPGKANSQSPMLAKDGGVASEKIDKQATPTTSIKSVRSSSSQKKFPVVVIKKQEAPDSESESEDEDVPETLDVSEGSPNKEDSDKKLAEEEVISDIIKTTKAMEETLGLPATHNDVKESKLVEDEQEEDELEEQPEEQATEPEESVEAEVEEESPARSTTSTPCENPPLSPVSEDNKDMKCESLSPQVSITKIQKTPRPESVRSESMVCADSTEPEVTMETDDAEDLRNDSEVDEPEESPEKIKSPSVNSTVSSEPAVEDAMSEEETHEEEKKIVEPIVPKISIKLLKNVAASKEREERVNEAPNVTITAENVNSNEPSKVTRLNEVQITPIEKLKRKLPDTSTKSNSSEVSSDSEIDQSVSEAKKKKVSEVTVKKTKQKDEKDSAETENAATSPQPSNADDDSIFPSMFLDPSVTITVVENEKKADVSAQDICASVKLSSDVSLTIVEKSKSGEKQSHSASPSPVPSTTSEVSSTSKKPLPPLKGKSKARKSFATPPKQLISVRNPSTLLANGNRSPPASEPQQLGSTMQKELLVTAISGAREARMPANNSQQGPQPPQGPPPPPNSHRSPAGHRTSHLPQLQPRPFSGQLLPGPPSEAGPATAELNKHASKLTEFVRQSLESLMRDLSSLGSPQASLGAMQLEIERLQWRHQQEMAELKHNADLVVMEMRASMESERARAVAEVRRQAEIDKQRAIEETKKKQWCAYCNKEALFYCCWNTSYCDYPCQQAHWPRHMATCAQKYSKDSSSGGSSNASPNHGSNAAKTVFHSNPKGLPPNVQLTQQQLVNMGAPAGVIQGNRPPQHFAIVPRPMQGGGIHQFAMFPPGGGPRGAMNNQNSHVAFPMQPHFFM